MCYDVPLECLFWCRSLFLSLTLSLSLEKSQVNPEDCMSMGQEFCGMWTILPDEPQRIFERLLLQTFGQLIAAKIPKRRMDSTIAAMKKSVGGKKKIHIWILLGRRA